MTDTRSARRFLPAVALGLALALAGATLAGAARGGDAPGLLRPLGAILAGAVVAAVGLCAALRERGGAGAALRASEAQFRQLAEAMPQIVWTTAPDGATAYLNRRWAEYTGLPGTTPDEMVRVVHPDDLARMGAVWEVARRDGAVFQYEFRLRPAAGGAYRWFLARAVPLAGPGGAPTGWFGTSTDIDDLKRAQAELAVQRAELQLILDTVPALIFHKDRSHRLVRVNNELVRVVGLPREAIEGRTDSELGSPHAAAYRRDEEEIMTGGRAVRDIVEPLETVTGTRWLQTAKLPYRDAAGRITGIVGFAVDITARKLAEEEVRRLNAELERRVAERTAVAEARAAALRESEERFRSAFDHAAIGMALVSPDGRWLKVNQALCALLGYAADELLVTDFQTLTHPADLDADLALVGRVLGGSLPAYQMEKRYVHKGGHVIHVLLSVSLVRDARGRPLYFVSQIQDITERRRAEDGLRESRTQLALALEAAHAGVWSLDLADRRFATSERARELHGVAPADALDHDAAFLRVHPDDRPRVGEALRRTLDAGDRYQVEYRVAGTDRWLAAFAEVQPGPDGPRLVGLVQDVSERKRTEGRLLASVREKEVMLKEIHHRVKNNLQIISSLLDLQAGTVADPAARTAFRESRGRVRSMALIHERLYRSEALARVEFGTYVRHLAEDLCRAYRADDDAVRLEVAVSVPPVPLDVAIPCGLLVNELVSNCLKYAFAGRAGGIIRVSLEPAGAGRYELAVADDGVGLPPGFDFRQPASFGLQLANTLAEQLGGELELDPAAGTRFAVRFASRE